jgi:MFS family permease
VFTLGSVACGASVALGMLVASRVLQGFGGALLTPVGRLILLRSFPRSELAMAMTWVTIPSVIGPVMGPLAGGYIVTYWTWRWIFFVNVPFGLLGLLLAWRLVPPEAAPAQRPAFDWVGFAICGAGLALLQFGIENLVHPLVPPAGIAGVFVASVALLATYGRYARRHENAALDLAQFRVKTFRLSALSGGLTRVGVNAVPFMLPLMLQVGFGVSPLASGQITFVASLGTLLMRTASVRLLRFAGFDRLLAVSTVLSAASVAGFALFGPGAPAWLLLAYVVGFGMVRNTQFSALQVLTYADIPPASLSRATSLGGVVQQISMGLGVSVAATLLGWVGESGRLSVADFHVVFVLLGVIPLLGLPGLLQLTPTDGATVSGHRRRG